MSFGLSIDLGDDEAVQLVVFECAAPDCTEREVVRLRELAPGPCPVHGDRLVLVDIQVHATTHVGPLDIE